MCHHLSAASFDIQRTFVNIHIKFMFLVQIIAIFSHCIDSRGNKKKVSNEKNGKQSITRRNLIKYSNVQSKNGHN